MSVINVIKEGDVINIMSYECFEGLMNILKNFWCNMCKFEEALGIQFEETWMTDHFARLCEVITNEFEGPEVEDIDEKIGPIVLYYMFDMEWGEKTTILPYKGINYEVKHLEDLYNLLILIKDNRCNREIEQLETILEAIKEEE